jgi:hypothetical protein
MSAELQKHIFLLRYFLELDADEIESVNKTIGHIINSCAYMEKEYAHITRSRTHNFDTLLEKEGTENHVEFSDEELRIIDKEAPLTLTVIHNHPNSTAPGHDDFFMLITHRSLRNMVVFGVIGSLYFVQKPNMELYFNYSGTEEKDKLKIWLKDALVDTAFEYIKNKYPKLTHAERVERIRRNPNEKHETNVAILYEYFVKYM